MRTWGRVFAEDGSWTWVQINTTPTGANGDVYAVTLVQCLKLNLGESPFYSNLGIPQQPTMISQVYPDYYMNYIQQYFAPNFASLTLSRQTPQPGQPPTYAMNAVYFDGSAPTNPLPT